MSTLPTNFVDLDPNHTPAHNATNAQANINSRPASVNVVTHSSAGALALDAEDGHTALVTVEANITSITTPTNMVDGLPFLLILKGDGVAGFTANLSNINLNSGTTLSASHAVQLDGLYHIVFVKDGSNLWAPAGVISYAGAGASGIAFVDSNTYSYTGSFNTSHVFPLPASYSSGDLLEVYTVTQESSDVGAPTTPAGWTQRWTNTPSAGFRARITKLYKISDGGEGSSLSVTFSNTRAYGGSIAWSGVDNTTPYDVASPTESQGDANPNPPSITPVTDGAHVIVACAGNATGGAASTVSTGYTPIVDTDADDRSIVICHKELATAAAEDPSAYTWAIANSCARTDALRPA